MAWDRGILGPFFGPRRYVAERFGVSRERGPRGTVGSGAEADGSGDRRRIRPGGIDRRPWPAARGGARAGKPRWVSNRVRCQAILGFQGVLDVSMAFMMLSSLYMQATTLASFPAAVTSWVLGEILLVIGLGVVERRCVANLGRDRAVTGPR